MGRGDETPSLGFAGLVAEPETRHDPDRGVGERGGGPGMGDSRTKGGVERRGAIVAENAGSGNGGRNRDKERDIGLC